ncbi:hypothetical protein, partial [Actinomadura kijaniata]|uniref:hypothetical protein n=1 Tax=Actinomadura kijaniata TaxID=46161 RepID=UPI000A6A307B
MPLLRRNHAAPPRKTRRDAPTRDATTSTGLAGLTTTTALAAPTTLAAPAAFTAAFATVLTAAFAAVPAHAECRCWRFVRPEGRPPDAVLTEITTPAERAAWAVGQKGGAPFALAWNGARWTETALPVPAGTTLEGVSAATARDAWAVGASGGTARLARWADGRWTPAAFAGTPRAVDARTPTDAWIAGSAR